MKKTARNKQFGRNGNRILCKFSGEVLSGEARTGLSRKPMDFIAREIASIAELEKFQLAVLWGGGNWARGRQLVDNIGLSAAVADYIGMLATVSNAIAFQDKLEKGFGLRTRVMTAWEMRQVAEPYIRRKAINYLGKQEIVILAGGIGNPGVSTDFGMVLRANDMGMTRVFKGTKVDGVYDDDPRKNPKARLIPKISYDEYLSRQLKIVDSTAVALAQAHGLTITVFNIFKKGNLGRVLSGEHVGSTICK